ncbi:anhydro-N-acetylmuramic acid kinase [Thalassomonas sp. M1454]|uniref:anhydro-N-acetylmuramic acid kinase n=1 Tax=Thalassomonas sp. M1454 TaxID=2594477 RepID=UPI00117E8580|nr:anhydro-N-acetylmuramic acid kinase [Thalassomonas sp. M1454]TRX55897.1 anhydro-N-acetylmuramic acid kinase [Thalassomonas sp. M1454]
MTHQEQSPIKLYIGLMSGTSADGIDLALVDFTNTPHQLIASYYQAYDEQTRAQITSLYTPNTNEIDRAGALDKVLAQQFADAIKQFLLNEKLKPEDICAIGNHGQTIRHRPITKQPFTLQIGCNQTLACLTGIKVIGKFRDKDIALGGQGAPLVPAYHQEIFKDENKDVCIVNIGGISNITYLPVNQENKILGFDTGPGNALLDDWYRLHFPDCPKGIDLDGKWSATGVVNQALLDAMLTDPFFALPAPKSTGREYFHIKWLRSHLHAFTAADIELHAEDIQATLLALTCHSIAKTINQLSKHGDIILCGGGANNPLLTKLIRQLCPSHNVCSAQDKGVDNDSLEALVFAWLAYAYDYNINGNLPAVTGASKATRLGLKFYP